MTYKEAVKAGEALAETSRLAARPSYVDEDLWFASGGRRVLYEAALRYAAERIQRESRVLVKNDKGEYIDRPPGRKSGRRGTEKEYALAFVAHRQSDKETPDFTLDERVDLFLPGSSTRASEAFERVDKDEYYLDIARQVAMRSTCLHTRYGAIIVKNDRIVSTGYNGSHRGAANCSDTGVCPRDEAVEPETHGLKYGSCVAVHAEQNAMIAAAPEEMEGATLYLSTADGKQKPEPCRICLNMMRNAGIKEAIGG